MKKPNSEVLVANAHASSVWIDACWPRQDVVKDTAAVILSSLLMALLAQVAVPLPFSPVPITGQTFGVLLLGAALGARRAALALVLYLVEGVVGLPVFAPGTMIGPARLVGPTAGYLLAFPAAAFVLGWLAERGWSRSVWRLTLAMLLAEAVIFSGGIAWLVVVTRAPLAVAFEMGLYPFLPGECVKSLLAALALPAAWRLLSAREPASRL